jgi:hypothetical protein
VGVVFINVLDKIPQARPYPCTAVVSLGWNLGLLNRCHSVTLLEAVPGTESGAHPP